MRVRKLPVVIGLLFLLLAVFAWGTLRKYQLDESSRETAIQLLEHALSNASAEQLLQQAHPQWLQSMSADSIRRYFDYAMTSLGPFQAMTGIRGASSAGMLPKPGEILDASYTVDTVMGETAFETIVELRFEEDQWLVTNLIMDAPPLME